MATESIAIALEVDDNGSVVVKKFSKNTVDTVKKMSDRSIGHVKRLSAKFTKGLGGAISKVGRALTSLKTLAMGALAGWGLTKVLGEFATFESALADMGKVTDESFSSIQEKVMKLPASLGSATELVKGYYQTISAGVKGAVNQMETLVTASKLAKTAHAAQESVIIGLSSVMDAFKESSSTAADAMQTMEKTGKTTVGALIPIIGEISSSAAALGLDLNEMGAGFAAVTLQSGGTEKAATQYKALLVSMIAPTKDMTSLLLKYGGIQAAIKQIGFGGVMKMIAKATGGNAEATKKLLGSVEAYLGFLSVSANNMQTYNQNLEEQKNKTGAVDKAWKDYMQTLNAIWDTFKNTIGKQVILIGEKLAPAVKRITTAVGEWLAKNREFITLKFEGWINNALGGLASFVEGVVAAVGGIYKIKTAVSETISFLAAKFEGWINIALGGLASFVEGVAGAVGSIYKLKAAVHESISFLAAMGAALTDVAAALALLDPINAVKASIYGFRETFPTLAKMRDRFDALGKSQADAAAEAENSSEKYAGYAEKIKGIAGEIRDLVSKPATMKVEDHATPALKKIQSEMAKIKSKTVYIKVVHTGTGSTERPLTDKIKEITNLYGTIPNQMAFNADFTSYTGGLTQLADTIHSLNFKARSFAGSKWWAGVSYSAAEMSSQLTGVFNRAIREGQAAPASVSGGGDISIGEVNITVPDSTAPQTAEDWRFITREYIVPELERIGHA